MNIGLVSFAGAANVVRIAQDYHINTAKIIKKTGHNLINIEDLIMNDKDNREAIECLQNSFLDLIVIEIGTFAQGNMIVDLIEAMKDVPIFVRGYVDPVVPECPTIPLNSMTGFLMTTSFLKRTNTKFSWSYSESEDKNAEEKLLTTIKALEVKKKLSKARYAVVGSRVPGFYISTVDELKFRRQIGPEIVYLSIATLLDEAKKISNERVTEKMNELKKAVRFFISEEQVEKNIRLFLTLKDFCKNNDISALTLKCWPELQDLYQTAGCAVLSMLNDEGIISCCEGDIPGLYTMDLLHRITGKPVFFADLVGKSKKGALKTWHCGFGPHGLCKAGCEISYTEQAVMRSGIGVGVLYEAKTGRVTLCKVSEQEKQYKLFYVII